MNKVTRVTRVRCSSDTSQEPTNSALSSVKATFFEDRYFTVELPHPAHQHSPLSDTFCRGFDI